jgi:hypothetical protein
VSSFVVVRIHAGPRPSSVALDKPSAQSGALFHSGQGNLPLQRSDPTASRLRRHGPWASGLAKRGALGYRVASASVAAQSWELI